jgi:hypothetical protein
VKANINYLDDKGEPRVILTSLFDFFDIPAREMTTRPTLRFGLPRKMIPFLECSGRWGRIKAEITCAMTSRYAIALYELVQLRSGLEKSLETVTIDRFRELLSVPPGKYDRVDNLMRKVIEPAVLQVNGLSDMGVMSDHADLLARNSPNMPAGCIDRTPRSEWSSTITSMKRTRRS